MKTLFITKRLKKNLEHYRIIPETRILIDFLIKSQIKIAKPSKRDAIPELVRDVFLLNWRASDNVIVCSNFDSEFSIFIHNGVHFLISKAFGEEIKGQKNYVFLSETIALCASIYFALKYHLKFGLKSEVAQIILLGYEEQFEKTNLHYLRLYKKALHDPEGTFRKLVKEGYGLIKKLDQNECQGFAKGYRNYRSLEKHISKLEFWPLIATFDYSLILLYASKFSGNKESPIGQKNAKELENLLVKSKSFEDLLFSLIERAGR